MGEERRGEERGGDNRQVVTEVARSGTVRLLPTISAAISWPRRPTADRAGHSELAQITGPTRRSGTRAGPPQCRQWPPIADAGLAADSARPLRHTRRGSSGDGAVGASLPPLPETLAEPVSGRCRARVPALPYAAHGPAPVTDQ